MMNSPHAELNSEPQHYKCCALTIGAMRAARLNCGKFTHYITLHIDYRVRMKNNTYPNWGLFTGITACWGIMPVVARHWLRREVPTASEKKHRYNCPICYSHSHKPRHKHRHALSKLSVLGLNQRPFDSLLQERIARWKS